MIVLICMPAMVFAQRDHIHLSKKRAAAVSGSMLITAAAIGLHQEFRKKNKMKVHFANMPEYILWHKEIGKSI